MSINLGSSAILYFLRCSVCFQHPFKILKNILNLYRNFIFCSSSTLFTFLLPSASFFAHSHLLIYSSTHFNLFMLLSAVFNKLFSAKFLIFAILHMLFL